MKTSSPTRVLVIDDDPSILRLFRTVLEQSMKPATVSGDAEEGAVKRRAIQVDAAISGAEGVRMFDAAFRAGKPYSIAFVDLMMPEIDGIQTMRLLWDIDPLLLVVTFSSSERALCLAELAKSKEANRLLSLRKPLHPVEIRQAVRFLDGRKRAEQSLRKKSVKLDERMRYLDCLHTVSQVLEDATRPVPSLLAAVVGLIPSGFRHSERISVRIVFRGEVYAPQWFRETEWKLASPLIVAGQLAGALEVCRAEPPSNAKKKPFSPGERALAGDLANRLGELLARKEAEERLQASEARHRALFENSQDAILVLDPTTGMFTAANPAAVKLYGLRDENQFALLSPAELSPEHQPDGRSSKVKSLEMIARAIREGSGFFEWRHKRLDGVEFPSTVLLAPFQLGDQVFVQATVRDISRQMQMQAELAQAQRLEAIGQLAAGIAHEINTPTQYIGDNTRFLSDAFQELRGLLALLEQLPAFGERPSDALLDQLETASRGADLSYLTREIPRAIEQSLEGIDRVAKIVRAMKEFSHPGSEGKTAVDLNHAIESTLTVCRNEWKYVADLVTDFDPELPPVVCIQAELNQAILNMIINAAHAIYEKVGEGGEKGVITVRTRYAGDAAEIRIEDTGVGIPERLIPKIYDLFFTTKPVGKGTGQGLTLAQSIIVERHDGKIECRSKEGEGTVFTIRLPLVPAASQPDVYAACADAVGSDVPDQTDPVFGWPTQPVN